MPFTQVSEEVHELKEVGAAMQLATLGKQLAPELESVQTV
jgi:hypothetical protein